MKKMRRCEDVRSEDVKMFDRPPLLEEPFAQTLSGIILLVRFTQGLFGNDPFHH